MRTGLTLGKFAPLHKGHQYLIETALAEVDRLVVLVYDCPETTTCPLPIRANWIRQLYPTVEVIEAWDGPAAIGDTPEIRRLQEDFILRVLAGREISDFYSSEFYGDHVSKALEARDRRIDPPRETFPVSGTSVRDDPYSCREYLDAVVYRDLVTKVVFLGAPSTGKTTLAAEMAHACSTVWMPEYGREYWEKHQSNRRLTQEQLVEIAEGHRRREDVLVLQANGTLFVDTDATTTYMFSHYYHGEAHPRLAELADQTLNRYDLFFLCEADIPYDDTWDRSGEVNRGVFQKQIRADLLRRRIPFITLRGDLADRMQCVQRIVRGFDRFDSIGNALRK